MSEARREDTVLVIGLGDLGQRIATALGSWPGGRLVVAARDRGHAEAVAGQVRLIAALHDGPRVVEAVRVDLNDHNATAAVLAGVQPDVVVHVASELTWWRLPERVAGVPYGAWLPLHVTLVRKLMEARAAARLDAPVVALAYPDAVGPVLAGAGLAPQLGAGNVLEIAAKLHVLATGNGTIERKRVEVRLIAHHATERMAFSAFAALGGAGPSGPPPVLARVHVDGEVLPSERVNDMLTAAYALPPGRATHDLTAAATIATIGALLSTAPLRLHAPAPSGRPGGYPVLVSRNTVELDLPEGVTESDAIAINSVAARWDGIELIDDDGTMTYSAWAADAIEHALGVRIERVTLDDQAAVATVLAERLDRLGSQDAA